MYVSPNTKFSRLPPQLHRRKTPTAEQYPSGIATTRHSHGDRRQPGAQCPHIHRTSPWGRTFSPLPIGATHRGPRPRVPRTSPWDAAQIRQHRRHDSRPINPWVSITINAQRAPPRGITVVTLWKRPPAEQTNRENDRGFPSIPQYHPTVAATSPHLLLRSMSLAPHVPETA